MQEQKRNDVELNPTAASILGFLVWRSPMTGYELLKSVENSVGNFWHMTKSQMYSELKRLQLANYIEMGDAGARGQRPCRLTDEGKEAFEVWVQRDPALERVRFPLALTVFFRGSVPNPMLLEILAKHETGHLDRLAHYRSLLTFEEKSLNQMLTVRLGIRYEEAVLAWIEDVRLAIAVED